MILDSSFVTVIVMMSVAAETIQTAGSISMGSAELFFRRRAATVVGISWREAQP